MKTFRDYLIYQSFLSLSELNINLFVSQIKINLLQTRVVRQRDTYEKCHVIIKFLKISERNNLTKEIRDFSCLKFVSKLQTFIYVPYHILTSKDKTQKCDF